MSLTAQKLLFSVLHAVVFCYSYQKMQGRKNGSHSSICSTRVCDNPWSCHWTITSQMQKRIKNKTLAGKLTDEKKAIRMVLFHPQLRSWLQASLDAVKSVALTECQVKEGGFHKGLEIVATNRSKVVSSPKTFKLLCDLSRIDLMHWLRCESKSLNIWQLCSRWLYMWRWFLLECQSMCKSKAAGGG